MDQVIHFVMQHLYLWSALAIVGALLIVLEFEASLRGIHRVDTAEATLLMNRNGVVVDVNEPDEFLKGHILGAIHLPLSQLSQKITTLEPHKSSVLMIVANQERQALHAAKVLKQQGFNEVKILSGGLAAWREANLPLERK